MATSNDRPSEKARAEANLIHTVDLVDVRLVESQFKMRPQALQVDQSKWKFGYACQAGETVFTPDTGRLSGWVHATAYAKEGKAKVISLNAKYLILYQINGQSDEDTAKRFMDAVGGVSVYAYFRSLFADLTSQGGVRVPPLPVMKGFRKTLKTWSAGRADKPEFD